jgi:hypothetical protein
MEITRTSSKRHEATEARKRRCVYEIRRNHVKTTERRDPQYEGLVSGRRDRNTLSMTHKTVDDIIPKRSEEEDDIDRDYHPPSRPTSILNCWENCVIEMIFGRWPVYSEPLSIHDNDE